MVTVCVTVSVIVFVAGGPVVVVVVVVVVVAIVDGGVTVVDRGVPIPWTLSD